jgi:SAM-dependent methyltransferase
MVLSAPTSTGPPPAPEVVWHDLECGGYDADLALWRELAAGPPGGPASDPILEIGAGSGRVALELARAGHRVTALDLDRRLLDALSARAAGTEVATVCADARTFDLDRHDFGLCLAPMQTVQLLGGESGRLQFLRRARAHVRPGGTVACAIVTEFEPFDFREDEDGPAPETVCIDGTLYESRPTRVSVRPDSVRIERERRIVARTTAAPPRRARQARPIASPPAAEPAVQHDVIELDRVSAAQLEREAAAAGLRPAPARVIPHTEQHLGSVVVMLHV